MSLEDDLNNAKNTEDPKGWEQYAETIGDQVGRATVRLPSAKATEHDLLITAGFDPAEWRISGKINTRRWMRYDQEWLYYYKFDVVAGESKEALKADLESLTESIRSRQPNSANAETDGDCFALFMSDLQVGKVLPPVTSQDIVNWYCDCVDQAVQRVRDLRAAGHKMPHGAIIGLGDIVESCFGHYGNQSYNIDLNQREQNVTARNLLAYTIRAMLPLFDRLTVAAIGGNHGERRDNGKGNTRTDDADNMDLEVFDHTKFAFEMAGVELDWQIAQNNLSMALNLGGTKVGIAHGHKFPSGINSAARAEKWMKGQVWGMQEVADCTVLVHGHWHHFSNLQSGGRHLIQAPALDAGSKWYTDVTGEASEPGVLTMRFDSNHSFGYDDLKIIAPRKANA